MASHKNDLNSDSYDHLYTGHNDNSVREWNTVSGNEIRKFEGHGNPVYSIALHDNKL